MRMWGAACSQGTAKHANTVCPADKGKEMANSLQGSLDALHISNPAKYSSWLSAELKLALRKLAYKSSVHDSLLSAR